MNKTLISTLAIITVIAVAPATTLAAGMSDVLDPGNDASDLFGETIQGSELFEVGKTYTANESNLGPNGKTNDFAFEALALFAAAEYEVGAGYYLPAGAIAKKMCLSGSYCPGSADGKFSYDPDNDQGIYSCPPEYPNSDQRTSTDGKCYRDCTIGDITNSSAVSGRRYKDGTNNCKATECIYGYHLEAAADGKVLCAINNYTLKWMNGNTVLKTDNIQFDGTITAPTTGPTKDGYVFRGWKIQHPMTNPGIK